MDWRHTGELLAAGQTSLFRTCTRVGFGIVESRELMNLRLDEAP